MYFFRNDYSEGAHPAIFDALAATNLESTVGYGRDPYCAEAIEAVRRRFACPEAVLTGVETRSSSPVRVVRGADYQSGLRGVYPCGEGCGYAGGIVSAAVDGIRVAEAIAQLE